MFLQFSKLRNQLKIVSSVIALLAIGNSANACLYEDTSCLQLHADFFLNPTYESALRYYEYMNQHYGFEPPALETVYVTYNGPAPTSNVITDPISINQAIHDLGYNQVGGESPVTIEEVPTDPIICDDTQQRCDIYLEETLNYANLDIVGVPSGYVDTQALAEAMAIGHFLPPGSLLDSDASAEIEAKQEDKTKENNQLMYDRCLMDKQFDFSNCTLAYSTIYSEDIRDCHYVDFNVLGYQVTYSDTGCVRDLKAWLDSRILKCTADQSQGNSNCYDKWIAPGV